MQPRSSAGPATARTCAGAAAGLALVCALYVLGVLATGLALGTQALRGSALQRLGYVASTGVDLRLGVALVLAAVLGAVALAVEPGRRPTAVTAALCAVVGAATLAAVLAVLAVPAQLHALDLQRQEPTAAFNLGQVTYLVGTVGSALVALVVAARALAGSAPRAAGADDDGPAPAGGLLRGAR